MLVVEFVSDSNEEKSGFALRWKAIQPPKKIFDCDFDHGACEGWNLAGGDFPWQIGQGPETFEYKGKTFTLNINPLFMIFDQPPGIKLGINVFLNRTVLS